MGTRVDGAPVTYRPGQVVILTADLEGHFIAKSLAVPSRDEPAATTKTVAAPVSDLDVVLDVATDEPVVEIGTVTGSDVDPAIADGQEKPRRGRPRKSND